MRPDGTEAHGVPRQEQLAAPAQQDESTSTPTAIAEPAPETPTAVAEPGVAGSAAPLHDHFENAQTIAMLPFSETADTSLATRQASEPIFCSASVRTVWYAYTPTQTGALRATIANADEQYHIANLVAFTGSTLPGLSQNGCITDGISDGVLDVSVVAGQKIYFQVSPTYYNAGALIAFTLEAIPPPPNDHFAQGTSIGSLPSTRELSLRSATVEPGEPPSCQFTPVASAWYVFTADSAMTLNIISSPVRESTWLEVEVFSGTGLSNLARLAGCKERAQVDIAAGSTVFVRISSPQRGDARLAFQSVVPPQNDHFAGRETITSLPFSASVDIDSATWEAAEPRTCSDGRLHNSVWYTFTAPGDMALQFGTSAISQLVGVFEGTELTNLTARGCHYGGSRLTLNAGQTVHLQVIGNAYAQSLPFSIAELVAPAHDFFSGAKPIAALPFADSTDTTNVTTQPGEPTTCRNGITMYSTLWYRFTAATDITLVAEVNPAAGTYGGRIAAYSGGLLNGLTEHACVWGKLRLRVSAGQEIWLQVSSNVSNAADLRVSGFTPTGNDDFADAAVIPSLPFTHTEPDIGGATMESGEPLDCVTGAGTIWYSYSPPEDVVVSVDTDAPNYVGAYRGTAVGSLTSLACSFDAPSRFLVPAGTTAYIRGSGSGSFTLRVQALVPPPNDRFSNPQEITALPFSADLNLDTASRDPDEPRDCDNRASVWYRYTAPSDLILVATVETGSSVAVYSGQQVNALTLLDCGYAERPARLPLVAGQTVLIKYSGANGRLKVDVGSRPPNDDFANAQQVTAVPFESTARLKFAFTEIGESSGCGGESSVWYRLIAPNDGVLRVKIQGSSGGYGGASLGVFTGTSLGTLTPLAYCSADVRLEEVVRQGTVFYIQVASSYSVEAVDITIDVAPPPPHDEIDQARDVTALPFADITSTENATLDPSDPQPPVPWQCETYDDVWYRFVPPTDMSVRVSSGGSNFDTTISAYTEDASGSISYLDCEERYSYTPVEFQLTAGTPTYFRVGGTSSSYRRNGLLVVHFDVFTGIANDDVADAKQIDVLPFLDIVEDTQFATTEPGETFPCGTVERSLWYRFTAEEATTISLRASAWYDSRIAVYDGASPESLTLRTCATDSAVVEIAAGGTIYLQVGAPPGQAGQLYFRAEAIVRPENDDFADAVPITSLPFEVTADVSTATVEAPEPKGCGSTPPMSGLQHTVWYVYRPTADIDLNVRTSGWSDYHVSAIYRGTSYGDLVQVFCRTSRYTEESEFAARAGETLYIQIGAAERSGEVHLTIDELVPPANDDFASAREITSLPFTTIANALGATLETGEPSCVGDRSVWYRYTVTDDIVLTIDSAYSNQILGAYTGTSLPSLTPLGCSDGPLRVRLAPGTTLYIQTGGPDYQYSLVHVEQETQPPNDDFANRTVISSLPFTSQHYVAGATTEPGEPQPCPSLRYSVWYQYTAPTEGVFAIDTYGTYSSTGLAVYTGSSLASLSLVGCDDGYSGYQSRVEFSLSAGQTVYIQAGSNYGYSNTIPLRVSALVPAANDDFSGATEILSLPFDTSVSLFQSTLEAGEPNNCYYVDQSVWFRYTATSDGAISIEVPGVQFAVAVEAFSGPDVAHLTPLGCSTQAAQPLILNVSAGATVYLRFGSRSYDVLGEINARVLEFVAPANDNFAAAVPVDALPFSHEVHTFGATRETAEPYACDYSGGTVWYAFTAAENVTLRAKVTDKDTMIEYVQPTFVAAFASPATGGFPAPEDRLDCGAEIQFDVPAGQTVYLRTATADSAGSLLGLEIRAVVAPANDRVQGAIPITSLPYQTTVETTGAWTEIGEPTQCRNGATVWFEFTAPADTVLDVDTNGSDFDTVVAAYRYAPPYNVPPQYPNDLLGCDDAFLPSVQSRLTFLVKAGETVYIQAGGYIDYAGQLVLRARALPAVPNDHFTNAQEITALPFATSLSLTSATLEFGEEQFAPCDSIQNSVWYRFAAPADMTLSVDTYGSDFHTIVAAYRDNAVSSPPGAVSEIACDGRHYAGPPPPTVEGGPAVIVFTVEAGQVIYIQVGVAEADWRSRATNLVLHIEEVAPPPNDDIENATEITMLPFRDEGDTFAATRSAAEPAGCWGVGKHTVWYAFAATRDMTVVADTAGSDYDTALVAYSTPVDAPPPQGGYLACDGVSRMSRLRLSVKAGTTLYFQVGGEHGHLVFNLTLEREGLLPPIEVVTLSPIAVEEALLWLRYQVHDNAVPSVFDYDGLSPLDLCHVAYVHRAARGELERANRLNPNGDGAPCDYQDYIPYGELTAEDFAMIDTDGDQISTKSSGYNDGLFIVAIPHEFSPRALRFSASVGTLYSAPGAPEDQSYVCDDPVGGPGCAHAFCCGGGGITIVGISGPLPDRDEVTVSVQAGDTDPVTMKLQAVGDPARVELAHRDPRVEIGGVDHCNVGELFGQPQPPLTNEMMANATYPGAGLVEARVFDDEGVLLTNVAVDWAVTDGGGTIARAITITGGLHGTSPSTAALNLLCGRSAGETTIEAQVRRSANGICTQGYPSFGACVGRTIGPLSASSSTLIVGPPARIELTAVPDELRCDGVTSTDIRARLLTASGDPAAPGYLLKFDAGTSGTTAPPAAAIDDDGEAASIFVPASAVGEVTISVSTGSLHADVSVHCTSPTPTPTSTPATPTSTPTSTPTATRTATATPPRSPTPHPCAADVNGDGRVTTRDVIAVAHALSRPYDPAADVNDDGRVDFRDLLFTLRVRLRRTC